MYKVLSRHSGLIKEIKVQIYKGENCLYCGRPLDRNKSFPQANSALFIGSLHMTCAARARNSSNDPKILLTEGEIANLNANKN